MVSWGQGILCSRVASIDQASPTPGRRASLPVPCKERKLRDKGLNDPVSGDSLAQRGGAKPCCLFGLLCLFPPPPAAEGQPCPLSQCLQAQWPLGLGDIPHPSQAPVLLEQEGIQTAECGGHELTFFLISVP